jgi:membrane protease YdiL (CAAX protease family)
MSTALSQRNQRSELTAPRRRSTALLLPIAAVGTLVLLFRPRLLHGIADPTPALLGIFTALGLVGAYWPLPGSARPSRRRDALLVLAVGAIAFAAARGTQGTLTGVSFTARAVLLNSVAAIAEEAFFRRLVFGMLERYGTTIAIIGSACSFAVVHVGVWGMWVLPLDIAAGLLLSWQRAESGRWWVPAITHTFANVLALI